MKIQRVKLQMVREPSAIYTAENITSPTDIVALVNKYEQYDLTPTEKLILIGLNSKNRVNVYTEIATGTENHTLFSMSHIFQILMLSNSDKFILAHNHPSGDPTPSKDDIKTTDKVEKAASLMGLTLLDHIIISDNGYTSIAQIRNQGGN